MSVKPRKGSPYLWFDFTVQGHRFRGSCETDEPGAARLKEAIERKKAWDQLHLGRRETITLDAALGRYWLEHGQFLRSKKSLKTHSEFWLRHFGEAKLLHEITDSDLSACVATARAEVSNATINRRLATLGGLLTMAGRKWKMEIGDADIRQHMLSEPECRTRWITPAQADQLIAGAAEHLKNPIRFALMTGCRLENVIGLCWEQISLHRGTITMKVKSDLPGRKEHVVPVSSMLKELLIGLDPQPEGYVFVRRFGGSRCYQHRYVDRQADTSQCRKCKQPGPSKPILQFRNSWKTACKNAGIKDFRFHDLRHTAASWMRQHGVAIEVIQKVLGHANIATTMKYAHLHDGEKLEALETLATAQIRHTNDKKACG